MLKMTTLVLSAFAFAGAHASAGTRPVPLFDGKTFAGWDGDTKDTWRIEDACIVGGSLTKKIAKNQFLATKDSYANFVLRLEFKLLGDSKKAFVNSGVQFRSQRVPDDTEMVGYQADLGDPSWWGSLYDESRRNQVLAQSDMAKLNKVLRRGDWNKYEIMAEGRRIRTYINGVLGIDYTEKDEKIPQEGRIGLQIHGGGPAEVWFKDITIQELRPTKAVDKNAKFAEPVTKGQRVFSAGHSFHVFVPGILNDLAKKAGIKDHAQTGLSSIGGSRVIQHWDVPADKNKAKAALRAGKVDVLTLAPIYLPDEGIENFTKLALAHNPKVRITIQEFWLPFDLYDPTFKKRPQKVDHNAPTGPELRKRHAPYFKSMDDHVRELNKKHGKQVLLVVPVGQAVIALREKIIAGKGPGLKMQEDLFTDALGHAAPPLQALAAYCHFAVIYRQSPVGLPLPAILAKADAKLNRLLQELAWEAVSAHPLSGVKVGTPSSAKSLPFWHSVAQRTAKQAEQIASQNLLNRLIAIPALDQSANEV